MLVRPVAALATLLIAAAPLAAQSSGGILIGAEGFGIGIGDVPQVTGVRINWRDRGLRQVVGVNATVLGPKAPADSVARVAGLALGLPITGADEIDGIGVALGGVAVGDGLDGLAVGGLGVGAGGSLRGITVGGLGVGAGGGSLCVSGKRAAQRGLD